ncbi:Rieske (2Fe-2S) protein [Erythrobacter sp. SDW2]|uniref:Rieske (2Fe-2S) protein n=1 Tax=Erythrobacter sp. SDW2 TaxID=2907154 RepID=UPI001F200B9C|nr:Rieske (2Fe-2S) protein [Erythrobacter sp. SDW2]UIP07795.1 Rieske (2Fe-2S) protein [Erythrobacter sp. SDW2]
MIEITAADREGFSGRAKAIDYAVTGRLHHVGNYVRKIPSNLTRMMENAHDWEHLPFVHPSSFAAIAEVESGPWGWRCKTALPHGGEQLIELLVDNDRHYWATTVVDGPGQGTQIHTQASALDAGGIEVDVRFYLPQAPQSVEQQAMILGYLQAQYAALYDEDEALMLGRQAALDERKALRSVTPAEVLDLGPEAALDRDAVQKGMLGREKVLVRFWQSRWIAHSARCPHALAPLDEAQPDAEGGLTCPWHGYRFDLRTGAEDYKRCGSLPLFETVIEGARLIVRHAVSRR